MDRFESDAAHMVAAASWPVDHTSGAHVVLGQGKLCVAAGVQGVGQRFLFLAGIIRFDERLRLTRYEEIEPLPVRSRELWRLTGQQQADGAHLSFLHNDLQRLNAVRDEEPSKHGEPDEQEEQIETCRSWMRTQYRP